VTRGRRKQRRKSEEEENPFINGILIFLEKCFIRKSRGVRQRIEG